MSKKKNEIIPRSSTAEYLTYIASVGDDEISVEMKYDEENIWMTQKMMAALYDVSVSAINQHLKKTFEDKELDENAVIKKYLITAADGKNYNANHYNLQAIIAVGFKVNNQRAVRFRVWASQIVEQYTIKGWVMDEERLKNGGTILTQKYFDEQLERIREIRLSERNFYQKLTDIYATSIDYDKKAKTTKDFFAKALSTSKHYTGNNRNFKKIHESIKFTFVNFLHITKHFNESNPFLLKMPLPPRQLLFQVHLPDRSYSPYPHS